MTFRLFAALLFILSVTCYGQDLHNSPNNSSNHKDTTKLQDIFLKGKTEVHARTVFMNTINEGLLKDDYAMAAGIGVGITTKSYHGFQAGISSFIVNNIFSSELDKPDQVTGMPNRYETGLYDVLNPQTRNNLIRIENLFARYSISKSSLTVGKMMLSTPFLNPQDGRMNVTMEEGTWLTVEENKTVKLYGGWLWSISPRSTMQWLSVANSFGLYPVGVSETGAKSGYAGNIRSSGIALANIAVTINPTLKLNLWNMLVDNVMNTSMIEINSVRGDKIKLYQGLMFIHQNAVNNGGNADQSKTYILKGAQSNVISGQVGLKTKKLNINLNVTRITGDGRYLSPREWGRDPFYTFMAREKNDGFENVLAVTTNTTMYFLKEKLKAGIGYGFFHLPDVKDYRLNKYGIPSYHQVNADVIYSFAGFLKGLDIRFLTAYKIRQGNIYNNPKFVYNKVNMANMNLIMDFRL